MLSVKSRRLALILFATLAAAIFWPLKVSAAGGVTVTPANPSITLAKDHAEGQTMLNFTNNYDRQVLLHLSVAPAENATAADRQAPNAIEFVGGKDLIIEAGQTATKTIKLQDKETLPPGSQRSDLIITQDSPSYDIGVAPQLRLPLITIKQDGAVSAIALTAINRPIVAATLPDKIGITLKNSGNMLAIPRGYVEITTPKGQLLAKGTLNTGSLALAPGKSQEFNTNLTKLGNSIWPGQYQLNISYGLGGGNPAKVASASVIYIAWWQMVVVAIFTALVFYLARLVLKTKRRRPKHRAPSFMLAKREVP